MYVLVCVMGYLQPTMTMTQYFKFTIIIEQLVFIRRKVHGPVDYVENDEGDREANSEDAFNEDCNFSSGAE